MYELNPKLQWFWTTKARNKVLYGGRASSKSHDAAGFAIYLASNYKLKFLCARKFQNKISDSVYALLVAKINASGRAHEFDVLKTEIRHKVTGSHFIFMGTARNLAEIRSLEGVDICWLEEAAQLSQDEWDVIEPTIRNENSEIWMIFNPDDQTDFIYNHFVVKKQADTITCHVNWDSNPWLSETMLKIIRKMYKDDPKRAEHVYGGVPKTGSDKSVINLSYILAAVDAHKHAEYGWEKVGLKTIGFDVADDGEDANATVEAQGNVVTGAEEWEGQEDELLLSCTRVYNRAVIMGAKITWDSIGVGAHAGSKFKELNNARELEIDYEPFNAGGGVPEPKAVYMELPHIKILNQDHFANAKAYYWDQVATRFRKTHELITLGIQHPRDECISIDSATFPEKLLDQLKIELSAPRKDADGNGRFKVESKKDLRARGIHSPNVADGFIMAMIIPKRAAKGFFD